MKRQRQLEEHTHNLDDNYITWMGRHNLFKRLKLPLHISGNSPLRYPTYSIFVAGILFLILAPAIVMLIIGTNLSYVLMAIYAGLVILAIPVVAIYGIKRAGRREQLIQQFRAKHPERKY